MPGDTEGVDGGFVVTAKAIYDEVRAVRSLVEPLPARVSDLERDRDDHETRIRRLEGFTNKLAGIRGVVVLAGSGIGAALLAHFLNH